MRAKATGKGKRLYPVDRSAGRVTKNVIAFGDNYNDISMLEAVSLRWANADDAVKRADVVIGEITPASIASPVSYFHTHLL